MIKTILAETEMCHGQLAQIENMQKKIVELKRASTLSK